MLAGPFSLSLALLPFFVKTRGRGGEGKKKKKRGPSSAEVSIGDPEVLFLALTLAVVAHPPVAVLAFALV